MQKFLLPNWHCQTTAICHIVNTEIFPGDLEQRTFKNLLNSKGLMVLEKLCLIKYLICRN